MRPPGKVEAQERLAAQLAKLSPQMQADWHAAEARRQAFLEAKRSVEQAAIYIPGFGNCLLSPPACVDLDSPVYQCAAFHAPQYQKCDWDGLGPGHADQQSKALFCTDSQYNSLIMPPVGGMARFFIPFYPVGASGPVHLCLEIDTYAGYWHENEGFFLGGIGNLGEFKDVYGKYYFYDNPPDIAAIAPWNGVLSAWDRPYWEGPNTNGVYQNQNQWLVFDPPSIYTRASSVVGLGDPP